MSIIYVVTIDVLANDTDVDDGHAFTLLSGSAPSNSGSVSVIDNKLVFNPGTDFDHLAAGATQQITLHYVMEDEFHAQPLNTGSEIVTLTITGVNDPASISGNSAGNVTKDANVDSGHL